MTSHLLELLDRFFPAFLVSPVRLRDPEYMFLTDLTLGAKGFPEGYLLANPLELFYDLLSNPMQEIDIRPVNQSCGAEQPMLGIENIRKQGSKHKRLAF
jgi:hypothetical protein